jgi:hypothetical protein
VKRAPERIVNTLPVPATLTAAAWLVVVLTLCELAFTAMRKELTPGLRVMLCAMVGLQLVLAQQAARRSAGAVLGLFAYEAMAVIAAIGARGPIVVRLLLAAAAITAIGLLAASLHAFPTPSISRGPIRRD